MSYLQRIARRWHRLIGVAVALPFLIVILSGLLLQLKKELDWVQPPTQRGRLQIPELSHERLFHAVQAVPEAEVSTWGDIDRIDVRPSKGIMKVQCKSGVEVQVDGASGDVLQVAVRRSDWIEALHDGSFFTDGAKLWIFLPSGVGVLLLWFSGVYLWWLPYQVRRRKRLARLGK